MSVVTKDSCARMHPVLLPFLEQCLLRKELNAQGGVLEIKRPKSRLVVAFFDSATASVRECCPGVFGSAPLDSDESGDCNRFIVGIPYCGVELDCESTLLITAK